MSRKQRQDLLQFVDDLVSNAVDVLVDAGLGKDAARTAGLEIARRICTQYGKTVMYVPSAMRWDITERDNRIWAAYSSTGPDGSRPFTRDRVDQLAKEFNLTPHYIYEIVRLWQEKNLAELQGVLPGLESAES